MSIIININGQPMTVNSRGFDIYTIPDVVDKETQIPLVLEQLYEVINAFKNIANNVSPERWGIRFARKLYKIRNSDKYDLRIQKMINDYFPYIWDLLRTPLQENSNCRTAIYNLHKLKKIIPEADNFKIDLKNISLDEISKSIPEISFKEEQDITWLIDNYNGRVVKIPLTKGVVHKGGAARYILKRIFKNDQIKAEIPIKDWDILVKNPEDGQNFMKFVGENDLSGIELYSDIQFIMSCRDVTINMCLLSEDGLLYDEKAEFAAKTGIIEACGGDHGLYGKDYFYIGKHRLLKPRTFERLIKFLVEDKAKKFLIKRECLQFFMGIALLLAVIRMIKSDDFAIRFEKLEYILKRMGQYDIYKYVIERIGLKCRNIFELVEATHLIYPFIEIENRGQDSGVAKWLISKFLKWIIMDFKNKHRVYDTDLSWVVLDPNESFVEISLDGFESNPEYIKEIARWKPRFLEFCRTNNVKQNIKKL